MMEIGAIILVGIGIAFYSGYVVYLVFKNMERIKKLEERKP